MIAYLQGKIKKKSEKSIILDIGNIGYLVSLTSNLLAEIEEKEEIELFIHSHIKEDSFALYGFTSETEQNFFKQLLTISGIGPKVALEILSVPSNKIKLAIMNEDEAFICKIPGIGKKTAKRVIMELKDKIQIEALEDREYKPIQAEKHEEALEALIRLGYQQHQVKKLLNNLPEEIVQTEEIITYFLKHN